MSAERVCCAAMKLLLSLWCLCSLAAGCAGGQEVCRRDAVTGNENCQLVSDDPREAAATAGAATAAWGVVGCTVNNCQPPWRCNEKTKQCEATSCQKDGDCNGFSCDTEHGTCR